MIALDGWTLIIAVCVGHVTCFHQSPEGGWSSKEACLLPAETIIEQTEANLDKNKLFVDEEHHFSWGCVTEEELHRGGFKLTNHKVLGGKWVCDDCTRVDRVSETIRSNHGRENMQAGLA